MPPRSTIRIPDDITEQSRRGEFNDRMRRAHGTPSTVRKVGANDDDPSGWNTKDAAWPSRDYRVGQDAPITGPSIVDLNDGTSTPFQPQGDGVRKIEIGNGAVVIDFGSWLDGTATESQAKAQGFYGNLAEDMGDGGLAAIAGDLLDAIQQDELSRAEVLETRAKGIKLLGLKIEEAHGDAGTSSAPLEGMSTVRHPVLLEACTSFQAGCSAELLPSEGPCKIRNDAPIGAPSAPPGQPMQGDGIEPLDELAEALQKDMNHFLTVTATEWVPSSDRMFFTVGFSGDGFKKVYPSPLKQRPMSEVVDPEDLIVSNMATDLDSCGRVTHRIRMRRSILRRMQIVGAYRDVPIQQQATAQTPDIVKQETAAVLGARPEPMRQQDVDYTIYEVYTELDLDQFAPKQFKGKSLPLPYRVTIEKDSRQVLEISRNWRERDPLCQARQVFVQYPFVPALGFYSLGFVHLLGNATLALTAAWREILDAGAFANFPGFVYAKQAGRQLTNQFRCPPGGGVGLDLPPGSKISDLAMPFPYKEVGPAFPAFIQHVEQDARQIAMVANAPVAEGKQDAPVGTTLALIEQATKVLGAGFKRLHRAQAKEFQLILDLFREDPEAFWRGNRKPAKQWTKEQLLQALDRWELVPVADPNNPTSLHRLAKGALLKTLQAANPAIYDPIAVDRRIMTLSGIDPEGLFKGPQPNAPDPMMLMLQMRIQLEQTKLAQKEKEIQLKALIAAQQQQGKAADRSSKERVELLKSQIVHMQTQANILTDRLSSNADMIKLVHGMHQDGQKGAQDMRHKDEAHRQKMDQSDDMHGQKMQHGEEQHQKQMEAPAKGEQPFEYAPADSMM
jgi:hypothetical protein